MTGGSPCLIAASKDLNVGDFELFGFDFGNRAGPIVLGLNQSSRQLVQLVQADGLERDNNSWFVGDEVFEDGRLFSIVPFEAGWLFASLIASSKSPVYKAIEDILYEAVEQNVLSQEQSDRLNRIWQASAASLEQFLAKFFLAQINPVNGSRGFRFDNAFTLNQLKAYVELLGSDEVTTALATDMSDAFFLEKWRLSSRPTGHRALAFALEQVSILLSDDLFTLLCEKLEMLPLEDDAILKRLHRESQGTVVRPISSSGVLDDAFAPTSDYSRPSCHESSALHLKKKSNVAPPRGVMSITSFFQKAAK